MRIAKKWVDYECVDCGEGVKIERLGSYYLKRREPSAQGPLVKLKTVLDGTHTPEGWLSNNLPSQWVINYEDIAITIQPTQFKHIGFFPEQAVNWDFMRNVIREQKYPPRILNLFGYTGIATVAVAKETVSEVVHVDALKSAITRTQENITLNNLEDKHVRTLVDDVMKFLAREKRRGRTYHGIVLDPPSFGRGPNKEQWSIKKDLKPLMDAVMEVLDPDACFLVLNTYSNYIDEKTVHAIVSDCFKNRKGRVDTQQIGVPVTHKRKPLILGQTTRWTTHEDLL